jgi:hypothetical protein
MAIRSLKSGTFSRSGMVGNPVIMPGSYESIATVTVGAGGASYIEFTSIPSTYQHLQIRMLQRSDYAGTFVGTAIRFNSDTASNYSFHLITGDGSSVSAAGYASTSDIDGPTFTGSSITSGVFGAAVVDILDYANTSKYKTARLLGGTDANGSGAVNFWSGLWRNTAAISTIRVYPGAGNYIQNSTFALYGVN